MQLRLEITTPDGAVRSFAHPGPVISIGRDPEGAIALEGENGRSASWNHASIALTSAGAVVTDLGSSNGTLLNDQQLQQPARLQVGDRLQLGYTGATLRVTAIDLSAGVAAAAAGGVPRVAVLGGAAAAAVLLVVVLGLVLKPRGTPDKREIAKIDPPPAQVTPPNTPPPADPPMQPIVPVPMPPPAKSKAEPEPEKTVVASDTRPIGSYVALANWGPSLLLQRSGEAYPWVAVRPEGKVTTGTTFVSLPGYRSTIMLDSGVQVTLWGNLPEFAPFPPLLESTVMFQPPDSQLDADLTLERGRIHLVNAKALGPVHVQARFLAQTWQITLPDRESQVVLELWTLPANAATGNAPLACIGLFNRGKVQVRADDQTLDLADHSRVTWVHVAGTKPKVEVLPSLPDWWTKPPDRTQPRVAEAQLTLVDWAKQLNSSNELVDTILTRVRESTDGSLRVTGLQFLAALDATPFLVDFLEDRQNSDVRGAARHAMQVWLGRRSDNAAELPRLLQEKRGYAREKAALVLRLMQPLPAADLAKGETYQELIGLLDHENLLVRDLAFWHLANLVPDGPKRIAYDPAADAEPRKKSVEEWRKLVPAGSVPPRAKP